MKCKDCDSMKPSEVFPGSKKRRYFCDNWWCPLLYVTPDTECPFNNP